MAIYFLNIKTFGRTDGSSAVAAAAYRAGERLRDERTGRIHDHTDRQDILHKEIVLPSRLADASLEWAADRSSLWNSAEQAETRRNARVAREYLVALPAELEPAQRIALVHGFSQDLADRYRFVVDATLHAPREFPGSDPRNFHAHLLATTREANIEGLGAKTSLELGDRARRELGLEPAIQELAFVRSHWLAATNEALRAAQIDARLEPGPADGQQSRLWIPRVPYEMERRGHRSEFAERLREEHAQRGAHAHEQPRRDEPRHEREEMHPRAEQAGAAAPRRPQSLEEIQREAREQWLKLRQASLGEQERSHPAGRRIDDDLAL
jgi:ATP-dependent exoDNAse (exonuclease V) alpha subunit